MSDLQAGTWRIRAVEGSIDFGVSNRGNEQVAVAVEFLDGPNQGRRAVWYGSFTEATEERTIESLRYLGWDNDDLSAPTGIGSVEAEAVLEEEEYDGKLRMRVKWINRPRGPAFRDRMEGDRLKAFAARMKGKAIASRKKIESGAPQQSRSGSGNGGQRSGGRREEPPPHEDDDRIPF